MITTLLHFTPQFSTIKWLECHIRGEKGGGIKGIAYLPELGYTSHMKVLVATKPKSGTHLLGNILQNMGLNNSNYLLFSNHFEDYIGFYLYDGIRYSKRFNAPLTSAVKKIEDNSYVLGHIFYNKENIDIFKDFKKINIYRDNDEVRKSANRFFAQSDWDLTDEMLDKIDLWSTEPGILNIKFDDMINKDIETINKIQMHLFGQINFDSKHVIEKSLQDDSFSKHLDRK